MQYIESLVVPALDLRKAKDEYRKSFDKALKSAKLMEDGMFYMISDYIRVSEIPDSSYDSKRAIDEFSRKVLCEDLPYTFPTLLSFINTYDEKYCKIYDLLQDISDGRADDGYNDLCDSWPLLGRSMYEKVIKKDFKNNSEMELAIKESVKDDKLFNFFAYGENYIRMFLESSIARYMFYKIIQDKT